MEDEDCCQLSAGLGRGHCSWCGQSLQRLYAALVAGGDERVPTSVAARRRLWARWRVQRALAHLPAGEFTADDLVQRCVVSAVTIERVLQEEARAGRLVEAVGGVRSSARRQRRLYRRLSSRC